MKKTKNGILLTKKEALIFRDILGGMNIDKAKAILEGSCNYSKMKPEDLSDFAYVAGPDLSELLKVEGFGKLKG